jgi:hypothetical protein
LYLAATNGKERVSEREARDDVGTTRNAGEVNAWLYITSHVVEGRRRQWTSRRENEPQGRQIMGLARTASGFLHEGEELGTRSEHGESFR